MPWWLILIFIILVYVVPWIACINKDVYTWTVIIVSIVCFVYLFCINSYTSFFDQIKQKSILFKFNEGIHNEEWNHLFSLKSAIFCGPLLINTIFVPIIYNSDGFEQPDPVFSLVLGTLIKETPLSFGFWFEVIWLPIIGLLFYYLSAFTLAVTILAFIWGILSIWFGPDVELNI